MKGKCPIMWTSTHDSQRRSWRKWFIVTNLIMLLLTLLCYFGWMGASGTTTVSISQQLKNYQVKIEVLTILRPKGLTLSQGLDIADALILHCRQNDIPIELGLSIMQRESEVRVNAISNKGAVGLMQLLPKTFEDYNSKLNLRLPRQAIFDPICNIRIACLHLYDLVNDVKAKVKSQDELWRLVLVAYSGGARGYPEAVMKQKREYEVRFRDGEI